MLIQPIDQPTVGNHSQHGQQKLLPATQRTHRRHMMPAAIGQRLTMPVAQIHQIGTGRRLPLPLRCRGGTNIAHVKLLAIACFGHQQRGGHRALNRAKGPLQSGLKTLAAMIGESAYPKK